MNTSRRVETPLVKLEGVSKVYQAGEVSTGVLHEISLEVRRGEFVVVLGVSGSGKSTLLNLIGGLDTCSGGKITVAGAEISCASMNQLATFRREKVGFVFQFYNLLPTLTAAENVEAALEILMVPKVECRRRSRQILERVGLGAKIDKFPSQLSGGEQQRVAIARALVKGPELVLADEPTGNLDEATANRIIGEVMKEMNREMGVTFILVTHNPQIAEQADRVIEIHDGRLREKTVATGHRAASQHQATPSAP